MRYRTFIHCEVLETPPIPALYDYFTGDDRWFSPTAGIARSDQTTEVSTDLLFPTGQVSPSMQFFGPTFGYDTAVSCLACQGFAVLPPEYCNWCVDPTARPGCSATAVAGQNFNVLRMFHSRVSPTEVKVDVKLVGYNPCSIPGGPAIDTIFTIRFRQYCEDEMLSLMEYKIDPGGMHDGFPWHELYLNNQRIYHYDPCATGSSPLSLEGAPEIAIDNPPQLLEWRAVPGQ